MYQDFYRIDKDVFLINDIKPFIKSDTILFKHNVIAFCSKGKMTAVYNGSPIEMHEHQVFICPPNSQISKVMITPDFQLLAMSLSTNALQQYLREYINIWNQFTYVEKMCVLPLTSSGTLGFYERVSSLLYLLMYMPSDEGDDRYRKDMLTSTLRIILVALCSLLSRQPQLDVVSAGQKTSIFAKFLDLLQQTECKHKTVEYYASELCISTKYLTIICKKNSDKTANQWIKEYVLADITSYLRDTDLSIKEIAAKVGFENASFFGKFVRQHFGCTPMEYRRSLIVSA